MIPKTRLLFSDGRIADVAKVTSPVVIVYVDSEQQHIFAPDYRYNDTYIEVTGQLIRANELSWFS